MKNKIVFFDVDGTLIDFSNKIPSSTIESLNKLKSLGHKIYICTGRSLVQLQKKLSEIDFNGIICASAAYVECEGNVIYENPMPVEDAMKVLEFFKKHEVLFSFQAKNQTLIEKKWLERYRQYFQDRFSITFPENNHNFLSDVMPNNIEKITYFAAPYGVKEVKEILGNNFDVTAMSFGKMSEDCGEITCAGINKAFGMKKVLEYYGMDREDSIAFGDGPNDFEMLEFANVGVAMGNAIPQLKEVADMVTTSVMEDGIKNGLEKLNLL